MEPISESSQAPDSDAVRIVERPDGFYWVDEASGQEMGPFVTRQAAQADAQLSDEAPEPGETLEQAEAEIGIAEWIDQDTGAPAEESVPRIEDH